MLFNEEDPVRVIHPVSGNELFSDGTLSVPAGALGTVVLASPAVPDAYGVEFVIPLSGGRARCATISISADNLRPCGD